MTGPRLAREKSMLRYLSATAFFIELPLLLVCFPRGNYPNDVRIRVRVYDHQQLRLVAQPERDEPLLFGSVAGSSRVSAKASSKTVAASAKLMPWARRFASAFRGCHSNRPRIVYGRLSSEASGIASEQRQDFGGRIVAPLSAAALLRAAAISCLTASRPGNSRLAFVYQPRALSRSPSSMCTTTCSHAASVEDYFWTISWAAFQSPASSRSSTRVVSMARV